MCRFSNGLGYQMPCRPLIEFREIRTHSRVRDDCHMSIFSDRDVTPKVIESVQTLLHNSNPREK